MMLNCLLGVPRSVVGAAVAVLLSVVVGLALGVGVAVAVTTPVVDASSLCPVAELTVSSVGLSRVGVVSVGCG